MDQIKRMFSTKKAAISEDRGLLPEEHSDLEDLCEEDSTDLTDLDVSFGTLNMRQVNSSRPSSNIFYNWKASDSDFDSDEEIHQLHKTKRVNLSDRHVSECTADTAAEKNLSVISPKTIAASQSPVEMLLLSRSLLFAKHAAASAASSTTFGQERKKRALEVDSSRETSPLQIRKR